MTSYRLFPSTSGPATAVSYSGPFISGVAFCVKGGNNWFEGYWYWCASNSSTSPVPCALWSPTSTSAGVVVPGSTVTSGTLTANAWNYIPLPAPVPLAVSFDPNNSANGGVYVAAIGVNGNFSDTLSMFNSGDTYGAGIVNGPLVAYSGTTGTLKPPTTVAGQGLFSIAGTDPAVNMPNQVDGSGDGGSNFWIDVQVRDSKPDGYTGTYRIWPNLALPNTSTTLDTTNNDNIAIQFQLAQPFAISKFWYYSPPSAAALGTWAGVYSVAGPNAGSIAAQNASPTWSAAAGSGWVSCDGAGAVIPAGNFKVSVKGPASNWGPKDAGTGYYNVGAGSLGTGITSGPIYVPNLANASLAYNYNGNAGGTPPFSDGTTLPGQPTFAIGGSPAYPYLFAPVSTPVAGSTQNYWVDIEGTPVALPPPPPLVIPPGRQSPASFFFMPSAAVFFSPPAVTVQGTATLSGSGTLTASPQFEASAALSGSGTLSASPQFQGSAALSGSGTLTASPQFQGSAALSGSGTLSASPQLQGSATLSGSGTLTASPQLQGSAALSGSGTLGTTPPVAATLSGSGTLTAASQLQGSAALSGSGTLTASPQFQGTAALSGSGTLSAAWSLFLSAALSGSGTLTAGGTGAVPALATVLAADELASTVTAADDFAYSVTVSDWQP